MGLLDEFGAWLDQKKRNVAANAQNLPGLLASFAQDVQQGAAADKSAWDASRSVMPEVRAQGVAEINRRGQELGGLLGAIKAYHGSPHKFDKFDLSKIGTGEGAQAYGHGMYMAENPKVAKEYAKLNPIASPTDTAFITARTAWAKGNASPKAALKYLDELEKTTTDAKYFLVDGGSSSLSDIAKARELIKSGAMKEPNLYEANIRWPDAAREAADPLGPQHFLDWDKPLSEQPKVAKLLADKFDPTGGEFSFGGGGSMKLTGGGTLKVYDDPDFGRKFVLDMGDKQFRLTEQEARNLVGTGAEGKSVYQIIASRKGSDAAATEYLKSIGIPGIRYLDGGSRGAGQGTSNYVIFDDNLLEILKRNGQPVQPQGLLAREPTKFQLAHAEAQRNAALPIEQGGLGLGPQNTAMERAKAMGFDTPAYHGTQADIKDGIRRSKTGAMGPGAYLGDAPEVAIAYAGEEAGANIIPALLRGKYVNNKEWTDLISKHGWGGAEEAAKAAGKAGVHDSMFESAYSVFDPKNIRSRFAAFDPKKRDSRDLLASMGLLGLLGAGAYGQEQ